MINFREFLTEMFDDGYQLELVIHSRFHYQYSFETDDGRVGVIDFEDENDDDEDALIWSLSFEIDGSNKITGGGDAYKIFSTVIEAMLDFSTRRPKDFGGFVFLALHGPDGSASRIKLYRRMLSKFAKDYGYTFSEKPYKNSVGVEFTLYNKDIHNA